MRNKQKKTWQIVAICLSFVLFVILSHLNYHYGHGNYIKKIKQKNTEIRQSFDDRISSIINRLPYLTKIISPLKQCSSHLVELLGNYAFLNPDLSAIAVKNKHIKNWCISPEYKTLVQSKSTKKNKMLIGPITNAPTNNAYFILYYPDNNDVTYQIYLLKSLLKKTIDTQSPIIERVSLITKDGHKLLETKAPTGKLAHYLSLASLEPSKVLPELHVHVDFNKDYMERRSHIIIWSLTLLSMAIAGVFLLILLKQINRTFSMNSLIKQAVKNNEFYPVFQPIVDASTDQISGAELLVRWKDKYGNQIMPNQFIEEAEKTGHIVPLTTQLITQAFQKLGKYLNKNRSFHLGINLCKAHLIDKKWIRTIQTLCHKHGIKHHQLMLEVTERTMIDNSEINIAKHMHDLHNEGFKLAIDDFGTSHASISYLRHFPLDFLKIDMMYTQAIGTGAVTEALLPPIILIANQLKLKIIGEGVETKEQINYLKKQNVDYLQGWYFSKALTSEKLLQTLPKKL